MTASKISVPLLDLTRQYKVLKKEIDAALIRVAESQQFILGPDVIKFEEECVKYIGCEYALGVSSGTDALLLALMALGIGSGDEVITVPYSFFATAGSIARAGAKPVFVDIEPESYNINCHLIERAITPKTKAIMPVHLYGQCAEMDEILKIAAKHKLYVIEDAAQSIGSLCGERQAGTIGDIGCYSFFPSKNLGAFGDAGLVTCNKTDIFEVLKMDRVHGSKIKYYHDHVGGNFRLDSIQAAVLSVKLPHLEGWSEKRIANANRYKELFAERDLIASISSYAVDNKVVLPAILPMRRHIFNQFVIRVKNRDQVMNGLKARGIGCEVYYPLPLHQQKCFSSLGYKKGDFPESERAAEESLAIPIFPELTDGELQQVVAAVAELVRS